MTNNGGIQTAAIAAVALVAWAAGGGIAAHVAPTMEQGPIGLTQAENDHVDKAAAASLFGQFRSSTADFLWLKVDRYLHGGVELRGMTAQEKSSGNVDKVTSADPKEGWKHKDETTVIPSAGRDWRGTLGNLERQVVPYQDMKDHHERDPKEALPLFRLMTWSNPHFISGYTVGAAMIARDKSKINQALDFLKEGEKNNPNSIEIAESLGEIYMADKRDFQTALPYLEKSLALVKARDRSTMTDDETEAEENTYRWVVINRRDSGDQKAAKAYAQEGIRLYPDDVICREYLNAHP